MSACRRWLVIFLTMGMAIADPSYSVVSSSHLAQGNNQFAIELYARIKESSENIFFSPYSISATLAMAYLGAQNSTQEQMKTTLHYAGNPTEMAAAFSVFNKTLRSNFDLKIANSIWLQEDKAIKPGFEEAMQKNFDASLFMVNFIDEGDTSRYKVNKWVSTHTAGKITGLLQPHDISRATKMLLVGAIYFQAPWKTAFKSSLTLPGIFHMNLQKSHPVPMMHQAGSFDVNEISEGVLIKLPYGNKKEEESTLSFWALVPREINGLTSIENNLTSDYLQTWMQNAKTRRVNLAMPKFHLTETFSLGDPLREMGMLSPFSEKADFSGITDSKDLFINRVIHKAYVSVNENGTEAAAATAVAVNATAIANPGPALDLNLDHPFLFFIIDDSTGAILFMGRLAAL